jgi:hypothetical protein
MSYSFIGKVFPDFNKITPKPICQSPSVNVYDEKLYKAPMVTQNALVGKVETFQSDNANITPLITQDPDADTKELLVHLNYILNNNICKDILMKKWGSQSPDRFDIFLYILFAFFLLVIYERIIKRR